MDLRKLMGLVMASKPADWRRMDGGPFTHPNMDRAKTPSEMGDFQNYDTHSNMAVYIPDVSISMLWGLTWREDFVEPWVEYFPDKKTSACWLDVLLHNSLVFRTPFVVVDGGRASLPLPRIRAKKYEVSRSQYELIKMLDEISFGEKNPDSDVSLRSSQFAVTDEVWPVFPKAGKRQQVM